MHYMTDSKTNKQMNYDYQESTTHLEFSFLWRQNPRSAYYYYFLFLLCVRWHHLLLKWVVIVIIFLNRFDRPSCCYHFVALLFKWMYWLTLYWLLLCVCIFLFFSLLFLSLSAQIFFCFLPGLDRLLVS